MDGPTLNRSAEAGSSSTNNGGNSWYVVDNHGTMTVESGSIISTSYYSSLLRNIGATLNVKGGTMESNFIVLKNDDEGVMNITGGTITTKALAAAPCKTGVRPPFPAVPSMLPLTRRLFMP